MSTTKTTIDVETLTKTIIAAMPEIQARSMSLLGRRPKRLPRRDQVIFERNLRRYAEKIFAQFESIANSTGGAEPGKVATVIECLMTNGAQAMGIRRRPGEDICEFFRRFALKQTAPRRHPWAKSPQYQKTRQALWEFVVQVHERLRAPAVFTAFEHWAEREGEGHISFTRQLDTAARCFRRHSPVRLTDRLVLDLQNEYRLVSAFFERRLRLLIYLAREGTAKSKPWSEWKKERLNNLLDMATTELSLTAIIGAIDRQVRNALAHGVPTIDLVAREVEFHDSLHPPIRWTFQEFFERTRSLTVTAAALNSVEPFIQSVQVYWLTSALRSLKAGPTR